MTAAALLAALSGCADDDPADREETAPPVMEHFATKLELTVGTEVRFGAADGARAGITLLDSDERNGGPWAQVLISPEVGYAYTMPAYQGRQEPTGSNRVQVEVTAVGSGRASVEVDAISPYEAADLSPESVAALQAQKPPPGTVEEWSFTPTGQIVSGGINASGNLLDETDANSLVSMVAVLNANRADYTARPTPVRWELLGFAGDETRIVGWGTLRVVSTRPREGPKPDGVSYDGTRIALTMTWE